MDDSRRDLLLKIGTGLLIITGVFPGIRNSINYQVSFRHPDEPWTARDSKMPAPYSLNDVRAIPDTAVAGKDIQNLGETLANDLVVITQSGYANIATTGAMIVLIAIFGLRERRKWAFFLLLAIGIWGGGND